MKTWSERPIEVANLLNPAFCGALLYSFIKEYQNEKEEGVPFSMIFLLLPIVLHESTREILPRSIRTQMHVWLQQNTQAHINFAKRTNSLIPFTKETLIFLAQRRFLSFDSYGRVVIGNSRRTGTLNEVKDYINKAKFLGKWFAHSGSLNTIFIMWGISL